MNSLIIFVLLAMSPLIESCIPMIPMEPGITETTISSIADTTTPDNFCDTCDISDVIASRGDADKIVPNQIEERDPIEGCTSTFLRCFNEKYFACDSVTVYAMTSTSTSAIGDSELTVAKVTLTCAKDGTYSWEST